MNQFVLFKRFLCFYFFLGWILCVPNIALALPTTWQTLAPGLQYTRLSPFTGLFNGYLQAFKIDLDHYQLNLVAAKDLQKSLTTVDNYLSWSQSLLAINGGFFNEQNQPLGLRINQGIIKNSIKSISWWGVFYIKNHQANIVAQKNFKADKTIEFAIQAGPRLVANGQILIGLKGGFDQRTALGINAHGEVLIVTSDNLLITTSQLAEVMAKSEDAGGLGCEQAINLDGGSSTQLFAQIGTFKLDIPGYASVADAVVVKKRH